MLCIDTSVLLVYTLTQTVEPERHASTVEFLAGITSGALLGATSFYALHEVHIFALDAAPDFATGAAFGKAALLRILSLPLQIFPLLSRTEPRRHRARFSALRDASDRPRMQAITRVNAEQASKRIMWEPTRPDCGEGRSWLESTSDRVQADPPG